jgi:dihydroorotate dehydrogenase electron transfer subunit
LSVSARGLFTTQVHRNVKLSPTCCLLVLNRPEAFPDVLPGQFVTVRLPGTAGPLLRRPYSIMGLERDTLSLLVKAVGTGSSLLAGKKPGDLVELLGPLGGTPFPRPEGDSAVFVAGGTGLAPIIFAARMWTGGGSIKYSYLLYGASCADELLPGLAEGLFSKSWFATLDGSSGHHGDVVSLFEDLFSKGALPASYLYSCGPRGMVRTLASSAGDRFDEHFTSLETVMACGVGACRGCTVPVLSPGGVLFRSVCSEGTVFRAADIAWEEWED